MSVCPRNEPVQNCASHLFDVLLVSIDLEKFLNFSLTFHDLSICENYRSVLWNAPQFGIVWYFFIIRFRWCILVRNITEMILSLSPVRKHILWFVILLMMLTLVTWWRWSPPGFSNCRFIFFSFVNNNFLRLKIPIPHQTFSLFTYLYQCGFLASYFI